MSKCPAAVLISFWIKISNFSSGKRVVPAPVWEATAQPHGIKKINHVITAANVVFVHHGERKKKKEKETVQHLNQGAFEFTEVRSRN